jgi:glycine/D-amino acid oxidase-like deaminating enzyme
MSNKGIIIVGAGIFGVTAATSLQKRGYSVSVIDPQIIGATNPLSSSTDISKLVRSDYGKDDTYVMMNDKSIKLWRQWNEKWKEDFYHESGVLWLSKKAMKEGSTFLPFTNRRFSYG